MPPLLAAVRRTALLSLPFAAILAVGSTSATRVRAQTLAPGWNALPRTGVTNPTATGDYDWTGLNANLALTPFTGPIFQYPNIFYGGGGAGSGNQPMEATHSYQGTGGGNGDAKAQFSLPTTGSTKSTYYWQWVPPNNAAGQPDLVNFPVPPLFVLGKGYGVLSSTLASSPNQLGVSVSGSVSSGVGSASPLTIDSTVDPFPILKSRTDYAVLTPTLDHDQVYKQELSPTASYLATGVSPNDPTVYPATPGQSRNWVAIRDDLYLITLSAPNPLTSPLLGDGTNQYVYSNDPTGGPHLTLPATIAVSGCSADDASWLLPNVSVSYDLPAANMETNVTYLASAGQIIAQTTYNFLVSGSQVTSGLVYTGLPSANNGFGNHVGTLLVQGATSEQAHVQTFFLATDSTWPISDSYTPNWYHYYNQVYPSPGGYKSGSASEYNPGSNTIDISDDAHGSTSVRIFHLNSSTNKVEYLGPLFLVGIHNYIKVCGHELGHQYAANHYIEIESPTTSHPDNDNDGLDDNWELLNGFDPNKSDTTGAYANIPSTSPDFGKGDRECVADIQGLGALLASTASGTVKSLWKQDWANDGSQWGAWNQHTPTLNPSAPYWPWYFASSTNGARSADPPSDALSKLTQLPNGGN